VVLVYFPFRRRLTGGEFLSSSAADVPDCRRNRQNWNIRFVEPDSPIFCVSNNRIACDIEMFSDLNTMSIEELIGKLRADRVADE
jgi:hypothetical protein